MVLYHGSFEVFVKIAGSTTKEYELNTTTKEYGLNSSTSGEEITTTCFIEAEEDKTFTVWAKNPPNIKGYQTRMMLSIDGHLVSSQVQCGKSLDKEPLACFKGYKAMSTGRHDILHAFTFGKLTTTADGAPEKLTAKVADEMCTIRLDVQVLPMIGNKNHVPLQAATHAIPATTSVHEDSKAAMFGISAKPGEKLVAHASLQCLCAVDPRPSRRYIITYRYVPRSYLIARGHNLSSTFGSASLALNSAEQRIQSGAARSRGRDERDEDVKEDVKSEGLALPDRKRTRVTVDLTADGDRIKVKKPIRETIVISDDECDELNE